jgi:excisionase family DNA binding protein
MSRQPHTAPQLLTVAAAAELLSVSHRTVLNWIKQDAIPYVALPGGGKASYRIPMHALLGTLRGNYDLAAEIRRQADGGPVVPESDAPANGSQAVEGALEYERSGEVVSR